MLSGGAVVAGGAVAGLGLLLPAGSLPRRLALAVGGTPAALCGLAVPAWFLRLGRVSGRLRG
ncbi:hypothetical protein ACI8AF_18675 [Blastococcus sp. SYSU D00669]